MIFSQSSNRKLLHCILLLISTTTLISCNNTAHNIANDKKSLSSSAIYQEKAYGGDSIGQIRWLKDNKGYTQLEKSDKTYLDENNAEQTIGENIVKYQVNSRQPTILVNASELITSGQKAALKIDDYLWSADQKKLLIYTNSQKVWRSNSRGDYWFFDLTTRKLTQLGQGIATPSSLMFAKFSPDNQNIAYVFDNNIYLESLSDHKITPLTTDGKGSIINGLFDWVYEEEFLIRDGFRWSPDGKYIAYWQLDTSGSKDFYMLNNTDSLYPKLIKFPYPKVGETNALANIGMVNISNQKTVWAKLPNNHRNMYIPRMNWSGNSKQVLVQHVNRKQDTNNLYLANSVDGKATKVMTEKEQHFLDFYDDAKWINQGNDFIWTSERSGWRQLYKISRDGTNLVNLTPGDFDITAIKAIDKDNNWLYYMASPKNVSQRYLYRSKLDASIVNQRVTPVGFSGFNRYQMSENGQWAVHTFSSFDQPEQKYLVNIEGHQQLQTLMDNKKLADKLGQLQLAKTEFFQVNAQDGLTLDGYIMRPVDFDKNKKYPVIFYVYGEAWGQTVQDKWRGDSYLWDQYLTQQGYIVASIDNRGTRAPKGQSWRKSIYGAVGVLSSRDQSDALKAMAKRWSYIDTARIGIWGHSGGGSMTLNMLFRYPEQYHVGISSAPVADQKLYDTIYQERYSGLLPDHEAGYTQGSPITYAQNLQGKLLLVHGTGDDNVHYQGTEKLINELVKHHKQFEFMSYPNRSHSLREGEGTTLHYKTMKTEFFNKHLQAK